jgi:glycosyltransferase involved in cell wall biosynthesis
LVEKYGGRLCTLLPAAGIRPFISGSHAKAVARVRVSAYTGGEDFASARFRVRQYIPHLRSFGIEMAEYPLRWGSALPQSKLMQPCWMMGTALQRIGRLSRPVTSDLTLIQRQLLPTYVPVDRLLSGPRVLDVDDAIWLNRGGHRVPGLASRCDAVICGNMFLAERFSGWNRNVYVIPTPVDTDRFRPPANPALRGQSIICWSGAHTNFRYLYGIEQPLASVLRRRPDRRLLILADLPPRLTAVPADRIDFVRWSPHAEVRVLQASAIGIMPLEDSEWARGICSFKMLCYMACGLPSVVSPVGMNRHVLSLGTLGLPAASATDWVDALEVLLTDTGYAARLGAEARRIAVEHFSVGGLAPVLAETLLSLAGNTRVPLNGDRKTERVSMSPAL